jgi:hypothetical protein
MTFNQFMIYWCLFFCIVDFLLFLNGCPFYLLYTIIQFLCLCYFLYEVRNEQNSE